ncbi:hypothetical protein EJ110_NYTH38347 [Nymphaea thermarum]|nr:hypothetical protein EJ110_NYTH38347 [Nymphaea thermarum]
MDWKQHQQVWKTLEEAYALDSQERECCLLQKLQMHKRKNMNMVDYIRICKSTCDELQAIGKPVNDHTKVFLLLNGLGPEYESFITSMLKPQIPSYKEVVPLLQSHETMKQLNGHEENAQHQSVFYTQRSGFNNNRRRGRGKPTFSSHGRGFYPYNRGQQEKLNNLNQTSSNQSFLVLVLVSEIDHHGLHDSFPFHNIDFRYLGWFCE